MNPKIFVGAAAGILAVILVVFTLTGTSVVSDVEGGFTKAQTKALEKEEAKKIFNKILASGVAEFSHKEIKIWTDAYPTVQDELK